MDELCPTTHPIQRDVAAITYSVNFEHVRRIRLLQDVMIQDESIVLEQKDSQIMAMFVDNSHGKRQ